MPINRSSAAWTAFGLCLVGLAISVYLTYEHFTGSTTLACSDNGTVNCLKVTTSKWAVFPPGTGGIPVALAGLIYFVVMTALCLPVEFNTRTAALRVIGCVVGIVSVLYLVYVELFKVDAICLWCTAIHVLTLLLLGAVLWENEQLRSRALV